MDASLPLVPQPQNPKLTNDISQYHYSYSSPLHSIVPRPLTVHEQEMVAHLDRLKFFLATAPSRWTSSTSSLQVTSSNEHPALNRFLLPSGEYVSCVLWSGLYHITGTDIVRALVFRFEAFARPVKNMKKFEEGVFSDLRNLKPGNDACLEEPKSPFLDLLFKYQCIRTQKKQKVFYWFSVPHDRLFLDALERDLKREKMGLEPTTVAVGEPARSFHYDPKRSLYEQFCKNAGEFEAESDLERAVRQAEEQREIGSGPWTNTILSQPNSFNLTPTSESVLIHYHERAGSDVATADDSSLESQQSRANQQHTIAFSGSNPPFPAMFSLFEGSPSYKQRRKKVLKTPRKSSRKSPYPETKAMPTRYTPEQDPTVSASIYGLGTQGDRDSDLPTAASKSLVHDSGHSIRIPLGLCQLSSAKSDHPQRVATPPCPGQILDQALSRHCSPAPHNCLLPFTKTKAFVCPLFSCGRLFKRMEHLKRHLRTHTMEKPYQCERCLKCFSRSDNLSQHARTHARADTGDSSAEIKLESGDEEEVSMITAEVCEVEVQGDMFDYEGEDFSSLENRHQPADTRGYYSRPAAHRLTALPASRYIDPPKSHWTAATQYLPMTLCTYSHGRSSSLGSDFTESVHHSTPVPKVAFDLPTMYHTACRDPVTVSHLRRPRSATPHLSPSELIPRPLTLYLSQVSGKNPAATDMLQPKFYRPNDPLEPIVQPYSACAVPLDPCFHSDYAVDSRNQCQLQF